MAYRTGQKNNESHRRKISEALKRYYSSQESREKASENIKNSFKGKRKRDEDPTSRSGIYSSWEYKEARKRLVVGRPCAICGSKKNIHAHHRIFGDDSSLVPVCRRCHPRIQVSQWFQRGEDGPPAPEINKQMFGGKDQREAMERLVKGRPCLHCGRSDVKIYGHHCERNNHESLVPLCLSCHRLEHTRNSPTNPYGPEPPEGHVVPLCACGCGKMVAWERYRGWSRYVHGHASAKVPAGTRIQEAPLCGCGCGEPVKFRFGRGWNKFKQGHHRGRMGDPPLCACGCGEQVKTWKRKNGGWSRYCLGHDQGKPRSNNHGHGRYPPAGEIAPLCKCGCGEPVRWKLGHGWAGYRRGHQRRKGPPRPTNIIGKIQPQGSDVPLCACGCGEPVSWIPYRGFAVFRHNHHQRVKR